MIRGAGGKLVQKAITYQYVPLKESLKAFLSNQEIQDEVCCYIKVNILRFKFPFMYIGSEVPHTVRWYPSRFL